MPAPPVVVTSMERPATVGNARSSSWRCAVSITSSRSFHSAPATSLKSTLIVSPVISAALRDTFTSREPVGVTTGSVARFANVPPSIDTCTSPAASVGFTLNTLPARPIVAPVGDDEDRRLAASIHPDAVRFRELLRCRYRDRQRIGCIAPGCCTD